MSAPLVAVGDTLGLYKALAKAGPMTPSELAKYTSTAERYIREWLLNQAASGYLTYEVETNRFGLPPEHAMALADEASPVFMIGGYRIVNDAFAMQARMVEAFRTGSGLPWGDHTQELFDGTASFFGGAYKANLISSWIPSLDGVSAKLNDGAAVADVGCGHGASTLLMARAYPESTFVGFDLHRESIDRAVAAAKAAGLDDRVTFEVAAATDYPGKGYDLVTFFDCLHDMGDPVGASAHALASLHADGALMVVEPYANDSVDDNLNPVGRVYSAASTFICVPNSLCQEPARAMGAQAGEARLREVLSEAGYTRVRRATETPFNIVYEARP
jgi:2-polyprenyl-3-methyl-5-hydroxy-6-metoxy-1,4-benzoquinol methylase